MDGKLVLKKIKCKGFTLITLTQDDDDDDVDEIYRKWSQFSNGNPFVYRITTLSFYICLYICVLLPQNVYAYAWLTRKKSKYKMNITSMIRKIRPKADMERRIPKKKFPIKDGKIISIKAFSMNIH